MNVYAARTSRSRYARLIEYALLLLFATLAAPSNAITKGYAFQPGRVYTVNTALGVATQVVIEPDERVLDFGTGFSAGWDIVRRENIFYLKPKDPDAETNMYIRTDKRSYLLDLRLVSKDWRTIDDAKNAGVYYVVQFVYGDDARGTKPLAKSQTLEPPQLPPNDPSQAPKAITPTAMSFEPEGGRDYYTKYEIAANDDSKWLVPVRVYDDGTFTYLHFATGTPSPAVFGRSALRAQEYVVNKTVPSDHGVVVHGVHPVLIVRYGNQTVAIRRR
jgi:type IV secretion system protein VirB9